MAAQIDERGAAGSMEASGIIWLITEMDADSYRLSGTSDDSRRKVTFLSEG